jgi:hypothetical protein
MESVNMRRVAVSCIEGLDCFAYFGLYSRSDPVKGRHDSSLAAASGGRNPKSKVAKILKVVGGFIELAGEINTAMPDYVVQRLTEALSSQRKPLNGSTILVVGLAYKADVDDMRESPTFVLPEQIKGLVAEIEHHDPYVSEIVPLASTQSGRGKRSIEWNE